MDIIRLLKGLSRLLARFDVDLLHLGLYVEFIVEMDFQKESCRVGIS